MVLTWQNGLVSVLGSVAGDDQVFRIHKVHGDLLERQCTLKETKRNKYLHTVHAGSHSDFLKEGK